MPETITLKLNKAWEFRYVGRILDAEQLYDSLRLESGVSKSSGCREAIHKLRKLKWDDSNIIDFICLKASFLRRQEACFNLSMQLLNDLEEEMRSSEAFPHYQCTFQKGVNQLHSCRYLEGMKEFFAAKHFSRTKQEYFACFINGIICLEALGMPFGDQLKDFEKEFNEFKDEAWARDTLNQFVSIRIRDMYHRGDYAGIQSEADRGTDFNQADYHLAWITSLPYLGLQRSMILESNLIKNSTAFPQKYMADYRLGTIQGINGSVDSPEDYKVDEIIDRFYLWTWRWLVAPTTDKLTQVIKLRHFLEEYFHGEKSLETCQMYNNAMRWLGFFSPSSVSLSSLQLGNLRTSEFGYVASLELESLILDYLFLKKSKKSQPSDIADLERTIESHVCFNDASSQLSEVYRAAKGVEFEAPQLAMLTASLTDGLRTVEHPKRYLYVDFSADILRVVEPGRKVEDIRSHQLVKLFYLFRSEYAVSAKDIMTFCFGIKKFDIYLHSSKVSGLLGRANQILGTDGNLVRRDRNVYLSDQQIEVRTFNSSLHHVCFTLVLDDPTFEEEEKIAAQNLVRSGATAAAHNRTSLTTGWHGRSELGEILNIPRSTLLRRIKSWEEQGMCIKQGVGKATKYQFTPELADSLNI